MIHVWSGMDGGLMYSIILAMGATHFIHDHFSGRVRMEIDSGTGMKPSSPTLAAAKSDDDCN